jgi:polyketide synthase PksM
MSTARERDPIAIIGMSGRFPQSPDLGVLWSHLAQGDELTEEVTRWD